jgi:hypothetical protein
VLAPPAEPIPAPGAAAPPPPPPAPPAAVVPPPAPPAPPAAPPPVGPEKLSVGKSGGFFQPSLLLQAWAFSQNDSGSPMTSTLRLRRAEIRAKGEIVPGLVSYNVMIDPAKLPAFNTVNVPVVATDPMNPPPAGTVAVPQPTGDQSILQDYSITFQSEFADVSVGQFKILVSHEGNMVGASKLLFPERALAERRAASPFGAPYAGTIGYGDVREMGVKIEKKIAEKFYYALAVYNGSGSNRLDNDNEKDVGLRLEAYPVEGLLIGAAGYTTVGTRDNSIRDRLEGDLGYEANNVYFLAEYIHGWDSPNTVLNPKIESHGFHAALAYTFIKRIQPAVRIGMLDPNLDADGDKIMTYEGGLNYYLRGHEAKLQLAVAAFDHQTALTIWQYTLAAQASF